MCFTFVYLSFAVGAVSGNGKLWTSRPVSRDFYPSARSAAKTGIRFISCEAGSRFWFVTSFQLRFLMSHRARQSTIKFFSSFFSALFFLSYKWLIYSVLGRQLFITLFFLYVYIYVCLHACTDFPVSSLLGNLSPDWWVFLTVIFTWAMFSPSSLHTGMSEVTSVGETHRELKLTVIPSETRHLRPAINKPSTDSTFFNVALQTVQTSHSH